MLSVETGWNIHWSGLSYSKASLISIPQNCVIRNFVQTDKNQTDREDREAEIVHA